MKHDKQGDKRTKGQIKQIEELFLKHDGMLTEEVVPSIQNFNELNYDYFTADGLLGMKLRMSLKKERILYR